MDPFLIIYLLAVLGLPYCVRAFCSCNKQGLLFSCGTRASHCGGFSYCGARPLGRTGLRRGSMWSHQLRLPGSRAQAQQLQSTGLVALGHVGSSWIRDQTHVAFVSSVQFSHSVVSDSLRPHGLQHARLSCPSPTPGIYSNSYFYYFSFIFSLR